MRLPRRKRRKIRANSMNAVAFQTTWRVRFIAMAILSATTVTAHSEHRWSRGPIDEVVLRRQQASRLAPSPKASDRTLIRRLSYDLRGLPPTVAEVDRFLSDTSPNAYERLVDRLLASPHFGERMAMFWLDLARYADSDGYHDDAEREMWPYRDWVIRAFNQGKPFDEFTIEQLAGDLLPNATLEQKIASAFLRLGPTTTEDGANPEEYRARYAVDRVNTMSTIWLGLTIACAECHDHKYDSVTTEEYYQLFAFFNQSTEQPLFRGKHSPPVVEVPSEKQAATLKRLSQERRAKTQAFDQAASEADRFFDRWVQQLAEVEQSVEDRSTIVNEFTFDGDEHATLQNSGPRRRAAEYRSSNEGEIPGRSLGISGRALQFRGKGDAVSLGQLVEFRQSLGFTIEFWLNAIGSDGSLLSKIDRTSSWRGFDLRLVDARLKIRFAHQWPESAIQLATLAELPRREWTHVSLTYDGSATPEAFHVYVNGEPQDLDVEVDTRIAGPIQNDVALILGGDEDEETSFHGQIDELRFHKLPLSSEQLARAPLRHLQLLARANWGHEALPSFFRFVNPSTATIRKQISQLQLEMAQVRQRVPRLRIMQDVQPHRPTHVLQRGDFRSRGREVLPNTPAMLPAIRQSDPDHPLSRLDLARWLVQENGSHTARVTANRIWAQIFGRGIVATLDDFGVQGAEPTHPRLLALLQDELLRRDWDLKSMIRQIVMSSTYRQASAADEEAWKRDPQNSLLCRGPRNRLAAEAIRDTALHVSGLLDNRIGGPSVRPYQPMGLWRDMSKGDTAERAYVQSHGDDLYRRGVYTFWKRSIHYPPFAILDAPSREVCSSARPITNTPVQALSVLNDPTFVEAARHFAVQVLKNPGDLRTRVNFAFERALSRPPSKSEVNTVRLLYEEIRSLYRMNHQDALALLSVGESLGNASLDTTELATWTTLTQVILSLDETITKE